MSKVSRALELQEGEVMDAPLPTLPPLLALFVPYVWSHAVLTKPLRREAVILVL